MQKEEGEEEEEEQQQAVFIRDSVTNEDPPTAHQTQHRHKRGVAIEKLSTKRRLVSSCM